MNKDKFQFHKKSNAELKINIKRFLPGHPLHDGSVMELEKRESGWKRWTRIGIYVAIGSFLLAALIALLR
jgi:hypothetical protein